MVGEYSCSVDEDDDNNGKDGLQTAVITIMLLRWLMLFIVDASIEMPSFDLDCTFPNTPHGGRSSH